MGRRGQVIGLLEDACFFRNPPKHLPRDWQAGRCRGERSPCLLGLAFLRDKQRAVTHHVESVFFEGEV